MKIIKYFFVGLAATILDFAVFTTLAVWLGFDYLLVGAAGFLVATLLNYVLSIRFVFRSGVRFRNKRHELLMVYLVSLVGLCIHQISLYLSVEQLQLQLIVAKIVATGIVFFWNFGIRHFFVFSAKKTKLHAK